MTRLRVVIDTNVLVSAALKPSGAEEAVLLLLDNRLALFVSAAILSEYEEVLNRPKLKLPLNRIEFALKRAVALAANVNPAIRLFVSPDLSDNRFLECADAADADYLVTGNKRHFPARWKRTEIVNARELLDRVAMQ